MRGVKIAAVGVVVLGVVLAGCSSGAAQRTVTQTATVTSAPPSDSPSSSAPTITAEDIATDQAACRSFIVVDDPATQLSPLLGVTETIRLARLVGKAGADESMRVLSVSVANPILARPVNDLRAQVQLIQQALQYGTTISPSVNYATAQEDERQIRVLCGQIGVTPASPSAS